MILFNYRIIQLSICLIILLFFSCANNCQRAFYIPNALLTNTNNTDQLLIDNEYIRFNYINKLLFRHKIDTGYNIILLISDLRSVVLTLDADSYRLISIELPTTSLNTKGQYIINENTLKDFKNAVTSGGIQWMESSCVGNIKSGSIKYRQKNDSIYSMQLNLNIDITPINDSLESYNFNYNKKILFKKGNIGNFQKIPECPCPKMYLSQ